MARGLLSIQVLTWGDAQVYNTKLKPMNLVLFENALEHLARIERVLEMPRGNLLLVSLSLYTQTSLPPSHTQTPLSHTRRPLSLYMSVRETERMREREREHLARIERVLEMPRGNLLLVRVSVHVCVCVRVCV